MYANKSNKGSAAVGEGARAGDGVQPAARAELSTIDFSGADMSRALADCADMVQVSEVGSGIGAIYEEVAVLYANGNTRDAELLLEAVLKDDTASAGEGLWMMLLDLYQLTGQRERFESRVLDYATRFERSPPPWVNLSSAPVRRKADVVPLINLAGALSAQAAVQFNQMLVIGQKSGAIKIDLKRLRSIDDAGCTLLMDVIAQFARDRVKLFLLNGSTLLSMLEDQLQAGQAERRGTWLLVLELLQYTDDYERFEQLALDYAITFEESPPSWEPRPQPPAAVAASREEVQARQEDDACLEGELTGANNDSIRKLASLASDRDAIEVDCSLLRRMDFVSAGTLFNILSSLRSQGKRVTLLNVNAMVGALLRVMGVDQVATVMMRT